MPLFFFFFLTGYKLKLKLSLFFYFFLFFIIKTCHEIFFWQVLCCCLFLLRSGLSLAIKLHQHLSFQRSHFKSLCNVATSRNFTMKPCQHLSLYWSHANIHFCREAILALAFVMKSHLYLHWSHANIHLRHEVTSTLHISTKVMLILVFAMKPHQHFICTKVVPTSIFVMKLHQHFILALKPCWHPSLPWSNVNTSFALKPCQHSWSHEATPTLHSHWSRANIH